MPSLKSVALFAAGLAVMSGSSAAWAYEACLVNRAWVSWHGNLHIARQDGKTPSLEAHPFRLGLNQSQCWQVNNAHWYVGIVATNGDYLLGPPLKRMEVEGKDITFRLDGSLFQGTITTYDYKNLN